MKGSKAINMKMFKQWTETSRMSQMNNYIVRSYRDVIVITKFAITKYAIKRASKAQSIVMY